MDLFSGDVSTLVFKGIVTTNLGEFSLDGQMLQILMQLDGLKNLRTVGRNLNLPLATLRQAVARLQALGLLEPVHDAVKMLDSDFFEYLESHLSLAVGPIAGVLIEDELQQFGANAKRIPIQRAPELVNLLAHQIPRSDRRIAFQQAMVKMIKQLGT